MQDLFPGIDCPRIGYPDFNAAVRHSLTADGYVLLADQVSYKCILKPMNFRRDFNFREKSAKYKLIYLKSQH